MSKNPLLKFFVKEYRKKIAKQLFIEANGIVKRGLFEGMHLGEKIHWGKDKKRRNHASKYNEIKLDGDN